MRYILRLSARIFKNNKIKNSIVILAIAIAFSFVGIYFVFVDALNAFFLQSNLRQMGTEAEAEYRNVTYEEYLQFKKENRTLHCSYGTRLEQWTAGEYNSRQVVLNYMEEEAAGLCFAALTEGTWPETENEVAIDKNYGRYIDEIPIGSEIVISGVRYVVSGICDSNSKAEYASIYLSGQAFAKYKTAAAGIVYVDAEGSDPARGYNGLALCDIADGSYDSALENITAGLSGASTDEMQDLLFNEITVYEKKLDFQTALQKAQEYLELYPEDKTVKKELAFLKTRV